MDLDKAIIATIGYYDRLDYPLTAFEIWKFMINPGRLAASEEAISEITIREVAARVSDLVQKKNLGEKNGFYFLSGRAAIVGIRLEREKIAAQKWKKFLRLAWWLQATPWIRGMFASGSLALGNTNETSDFDVLVIAAKGRLYLARLFLSGIASLLGARRTRYQTMAPDKFCFNHYLTDESLTIEHQSLFNAQSYAHLVSILPNHRLAAEFSAANLWLNRYLYNYKPKQDLVRRQITESKILGAIARPIEMIFDNKLGDWLENLAKSYQQQRIAANPATNAPGGRVVYNDRELEFHPRSFERAVLDAYNSAVRKIEPLAIPEHDSGLTS
ncbi:MAG TPA: hypothetical protein VFK07_02620 [Candidatus Paceibacterota bacterium]|nr:hypothetical protein [Candidatus Paceibacterota bacterium]